MVPASVRLLQSSLARWQQGVQKIHPMTRGVLTYAVMWPTGSLIQQTMEGRNLRTYDWARAMRFSIFGALYVAPTLYGWVRLSSVMWPQTNLRIGVIKYCRPWLNKSHMDLSHAPVFSLG
ncbi:uncharacterized protein LOC115627136 isoform X2 [Scaptodrosophila lebanonensis]|uniref:Uncharacterized protein LOC115627136 isoform X2 n=1 Tax=Drosophila lebanonensis TaxID=7225 RepID=A0A6J2TR99_DROLE|nr:uncharacterized protein LOC115627136 isoform X2 [Scaptodrosophila lebanonensis]